MNSMKKLFSLLVIAFITVAFFACEKNTIVSPSSINSNTSSVSQPTLTATIDGTPEAFVAMLNMNVYGGYIQIIGAAPMSGITIGIPVPTDTVTYTSFGSGLKPYISIDSSGGYGFDTVVGTPILRITSYNSATAIFSGTFSCTLTSKGKHEVLTNGVFSNF